MITIGAQGIKPYYNINDDYLSNLKGELDDNQTMVTIAKFWYNNPGLFVQYLFNLDSNNKAPFTLFPFQEILIRAWFRRNFSLNVVSRGGAKSFSVAVFCILYCIFNPNKKIVICSSNFRSSRQTLETIEQLINSPGAHLIKDCFPEILSRRNDIWRYRINGGSITALPLADGNSIRGARADVLVIDELLLISEYVFTAVLTPFLAARSNISEENQYKDLEDKLILAGKMKEEDRTLLKSHKKVIGLSSASYQFEFLYQLYQGYIKEIITEQSKRTATYFVARLSYEVLPEGLMDEGVINMAKTQKMSTAIFNREYRALFESESDSYFSLRKMNECTFPDGEMPCCEILGDKKAEYILSIDPSRSKSETSDHFAMNLIRIVPEKNIGVVVHNFAEAGSDLKIQSVYLFYLLTNFNIVAIIMDGSNPEFLDAINETVLFKQNKIELKPWVADFDSPEYGKALIEAKRNYNLTSRKIVYLQPFNSDTIRKMNETLQTSIDLKKIWFASPIKAVKGLQNRMKELDLPIFRMLLPDNPKDSRDFIARMVDFIEKQDDLITLTKQETHLIEVKSTSTGHQSFELPVQLKRANTADKPRRDSYTVLLMGNWMLKCLKDVRECQDNTISTFSPMLVGRN